MYSYKDYTNFFALHQQKFSKEGKVKGKEVNRVERNNIKGQ
jgi:hypothetical protein